MPNPYFNPSGQPGNRSNGASAAIRAEFAALAAGFDKLPTLAGNDGKLLRVNGGAIEAFADTYLTLAQVAAPSGLATLDAGGKLLTSQLPAISITDTFVVNSQAAMLALTAQTGDVVVRTDLAKSFILAGSLPTVLANWQELLTPVSAVSSVFGRTGAVTLQSSDVTGALGFTPPSTTGSGSSGTWGISISGNAATATNATNATNATTAASCSGNAATATSATSAATATLAGSVPWTGVTGRPTAVSAFTNDSGYLTSSALSPYAPLASPNFTGTVNAANITASGSITASGNITAFSDARLKADVLVIAGALAKVAALRGVTYRRTDTGDNARHTGVIAQELQAVLPEAVAELEDGTLTVAYGNTIGLLIEAIKALDAKVTALEARP